jgi:hypothetical protein
MDKTDEYAILLATFANIKTIRTLLIDLYAKANNKSIKEVEKYTEELNEKFISGIQSGLSL